VTYATSVVKEAGPTPPVRSEREDWIALSRNEQAGVLLFLNDTTGMVTLDQVPLRGREYLRRHGSTL